MLRLLECGHMHAVVDQKGKGDRSFAKEERQPPLFATYCYLYLTTEYVAADSVDKYQNWTLGGVFQGIRR